MQGAVSDPNWKRLLDSEFEKPYFKNLKAFLVQEIEDKKKFFPPPSLIFNAFSQCSFENLKVVILGQDPYHGTGQAHGLSFSVQKGTPPPPSLQNIYKELQTDQNCQIPSHGNLESWANQGVLLLNTTLTVRAHTPMSHTNKGWETFSDTIIQKISEQKDFVVFLLWGRHAQSKKNIIDTSKHIVLESPHPSPFSAHSGFFGCKHFSQTNNHLKAKELSPINWCIS